MILEKLDGIKVFIIESLRNGDKKTGEDLKDNLRQIWYDQNLISDFDCQYTYVHDSKSPFFQWGFPFLLSSRQFMNNQTTAQLWFKPRCFWWHNLATVGY